MNLSEVIENYFIETKNIYINIAIILGLIIVFVISPIPLHNGLLVLVKIIIILSLLYLIIKNYKKTTQLINNAKENQSEKLIEKTIILSYIVNLALFLLSSYIWYTMFF
tara:strand:+ start:13740 stop:14066 length:327 start_codon:yes stop_codon:yes gene_type:complete